MFNAGFGGVDNITQDGTGILTSTGSTSFTICFGWVHPNRKDTNRIMIELLR
jgi:hypothetical protein